MEITREARGEERRQADGDPHRLDADTGPYGQHCLTVPMNAISKPPSPSPLRQRPLRSEIRLQSLAGRSIPRLRRAQGFLRPSDVPRRARRRARYRPARADRAQPSALRLPHRVPSQPRRRPPWRSSDPRRMRPGRNDFARQDSSNRRIEPPAADPEGGSDGDWPAGRGAVIVQQGSGLPGLDAANAEVRLLTDGTASCFPARRSRYGPGHAHREVRCRNTRPRLADVAVVSGDTDETPFEKGATPPRAPSFRATRPYGRPRTCGTRSSPRPPCSKEHPTALRIAHRGLVGESRRSHFRGPGSYFGPGRRPCDLVGFGHSRPIMRPSPTEPTSWAAVNRRTGEVKTQSYHAYQDCGTPINPALAMGAIYGGVISGHRPLALRGDALR